MPVFHLAEGPKVTRLDACSGESILPLRRLHLSLPFYGKPPSPKLYTNPRPYTTMIFLLPRR